MPKSHFVVVAALALAVVAAPACAADGELARPPEWTEPIAPFRIAGNLFYVGSAELTAFLFASPEGHVLLDAPLDENVAMVLRNVRTLGFDPRHIRVLINSHAHFDHIGGLAQIRARTAAKVHLARGDAELVARGGRGDFGIGDRGPYPAVDADVVFDDGHVVEVGGIRLVAHATPGHTRGCTTWTTTVEEAGTSYDAVFVCSLSVLDYRLAGPSPSYPGIGRDFCASVETLRSLPVDLFLAAHGSFFGLLDKVAAMAAPGDAGPHPFVDPEGYAAYVERARQVIQTRLAEDGLAGGCDALPDVSTAGDAP